VVKIEVRDCGLSKSSRTSCGDGQSVSSVGRELGRPSQHLRRFMAQTGGVRPPVPRPAWWHLSLSEREEISRGIAAEQSARTITERLGRRASTVSREITRPGGRETYRAQAAHARAAGNRRRPKTAKLAGAPVWRAVVEAKLGLCWSPDEIRRSLKRALAPLPTHPSRHPTNEPARCRVPDIGASNGLLRQYLATGADLRTFTQAALDAIADELNDHPRRTHGYRSPTQVYRDLQASGSLIPLDRQRPGAGSVMW